MLRAVDRNTARAKLLGLVAMLEDLLSTPARYFTDVSDMFDRYASVRDALRVEDAELFADIYVRQYPPSTLVFKRHDVETLRRDVGYILTVLDAAPSSDSRLLQVDREGVFFAGEVFDALRHIDRLIRRAKSKIAVVDGYVSEKVLDLLSAKGVGVSVEVLMRPSEVSASFKTYAEAFITQFGGLSVRTSTNFHDRFVVLDDAEFYHFGASLKDAGRRGFMFSRIEEPSVVAEFRKNLNSEWQIANVVL
jgi:hypothetical protein